MIPDSTPTGPRTKISPADDTGWFAIKVDVPQDTPGQGGGAPPEELTILPFADHPERDFYYGFHPRLRRFNESA